MQTTHRKDMQCATVAKRIFDLVVSLGRHTQRHGTNHSEGLRVVFEIFRKLPTDPLPAIFRRLQKAAPPRFSARTETPHVDNVQTGHAPHTQRVLLGIESARIRRGTRQVDIAVEFKHSRTRKSHAFGQPYQQRGCLFQHESRYRDFDLSRGAECMSTAIRIGVELRQQTATNRRWHRPALLQQG